MATEQQRAGGVSSRGFASMDPVKQREIARKGGQSVAPEDRSFSRNRELAAAAGRKGGENSHGGRKRTRAAPASGGWSVMKA